MKFLGRSVELTKIEAKWERAKNIEAPEPQLVIIKGGMGVGKTRLAVEFFRLLQAKDCVESRESYWPRLPDSQIGKISINPTLDQCRLKQRIPFLWWGIPASDPGEHGNNYFDSIAQNDSYIYPQLVGLSVKAHALNTGKALAKIWADVLKGGAASALGIDAVLSVGEGMLKSLSILRDRHSHSGLDAIEKNKKRIESRADAILADLEAIMSPASPVFAKTPAVFLFDDAQFAWADQSLIFFYEKLIHKAITQRWPALIMVTHWRSEYVTREEPEKYGFADIVRHASSGSVHTKSPKTQINGGFLNVRDVLEIDLKVIADLSVVLKDRYPELLPHQVQALVDHAGGNPRHMEQIIEYLSFKESYFEDFNKERPLTENGLRQVLGTTQNIFDLVLRRLCEEPIEVQEALCIASLQGIQFLSEIVQEIAERHLQSDPSDALARAANPLNMIVIGRESKFAEFSERLYLNVAEARRTEIKALADERVLMESLQEALSARVRKIDLQDALEDRRRSLLIFRMSAEILDHNDPIGMLNTLSVLSVLEQEELNEQNAFSAADRFKRILLVSNTEVDSSLLNLPAIARMCTMLEWDDSSDIMDRIVKDSEAKENIESSLASRERLAFALETSAKETTRRPLWDGRDDELLRRADEAVSIRRRIVNEAHSLQREFAFYRSMMSCAEIRMFLYPDLEVSKEALDVIAIYRDLAMRLRYSNVKKMLLEALLTFGTHQAWASHGSDLCLLSEALQISRDIHKSELTLQSQRNLADVLMNLGSIVSSVGESADSASALSRPFWEDALEYLQEAADHFRQIAEAHKNSEDLGRLSSVLLAVARAHRGLGEFALEIEVLRDLVDVCDKQLDHAESRRYTSLKFEALHFLGRAFNRIDNFEAAETYLLNARALFPRVLDFATFRLDDEAYQTIDMPRAQFQNLIDLAYLAINRTDKSIATDFINEADDLLEKYDIETMYYDFSGEIENCRKRLQGLRNGCDE